MTNSFGVNSLATRGPSRAVWGNLFSSLRDDPSRGVLFFDDFVNHPAHISSQTIGNYASYIDTGVTLKSIPTATLENGEAGVFEVAGNDATHDEGSITTGGGSGTFLKISDTAAEKGGVYFEARVKKATVATVDTGFFVGLSEEGAQTADAMVDTTGVLITTKDFIGFHCFGGTTGSGSVVRAMYQKASQTSQSIVATAKTMVADTWVKFGFKYQPWLGADRQITYVVDGVELGTYVTATNIAAATFPDGEELAMTFLTKNFLTTTESKLQMDWWCAAQLFPGVVP